MGNCGSMFLTGALTVLLTGLAASTLVTVSATFYLGGVVYPSIIPELTIVMILFLFSSSV